MIKLHFLEVLPLLTYLLLLLFLGFRKTRVIKSKEEYIVGGRQLTLPAFVATLVTTWYGGILGVGEFTYLYGLSNWVVFGLPYYIFALLFAWLFAPKIQKSGLLSIPDQLFLNYGQFNGFIGTIHTFFMTLPAPYVLMVGFMIQIFTGWDLWICVLSGTIFSMIYVVSGGFRSVVRTDKLQFILMFSGFIFMLIILLTRVGGFGFLQSNLPRLHLTLQGGNNIQYMVVWFFIALWTLIDPGFHQRCYAAKSPQTARKGILISVFFWLIFDFLTTTTGLYARALLLNIEPAFSYPLLSHKILPPLLSGLFLSGLFATIMSTLDSNFLLSAITIGHDFLAKFLQKKISVVRLTQLGLIISAVISILLALKFPSVIHLWYLIGSLFIPPILIPVLGSYYHFFKIPKFLISVNLLLPFLTSLIFLIQSMRISPSLRELNYWLDLQPMYPGLFCSVIIYIIGKLKN